MAGIINQTRFCIGNRQLLCSHTDLLPELCVIQTTVLVNSGDRHVYCPRRSRFRPPINTTLLMSSRLHSHLHPPLARPLSLSLSLSKIPAMVPLFCPRADEESPPREDARLNSSDEDPYAPPDEVAPDPPTLDWFWGQYNLCLWKSLSSAEKARQLAFKMEMAEEEARCQGACEARDAA